MTTFKDGVDALTKQTDEMREQLEKKLSLEMLMHQIVKLL